MRSRTLPFWICGFPAAEQERQLSCRRLGGQGGRSPHFTLSPLYTSRPPNRLTTRKSRRQESRLSQWATRKSPLPAGGRKAACPSGRQESCPSQQAARKPPVPVGDKKVAPPSRRQESRLSQWATRKLPLPAGGKKAACPNGRQESRPSQQAARKPPVPVGDKKVAPPAALPRRPQGLPVLVDCQFSSRVNPVKNSS